MTNGTETPSDMWIDKLIQEGVVEPGTYEATTTARLEVPATVRSKRDEPVQDGTTTIEDKKTIGVNADPPSGTQLIQWAIQIGLVPNTTQQFETRAVRTEPLLVRYLINEQPTNVAAWGELLDRAREKYLFPRRA